jgi:hypothetical protein
MPTAKTLAKLPRRAVCNKCGKEKPREQMVVVRLRKENVYLLRPRCKDCHNKAERGHRRQYKTNYLRKWRKNNPSLYESYWKQPSQEEKDRTAARAQTRFRKKHHSILIQGRMNRRGMGISIAQAEELLEKYGPAYPSRMGLTPEGLRECERIRSTYRRNGWPVDAFRIRLMVYEDGHHIKPSRQRPPFQAASRKMKNWWQRKKKATPSYMPAAA